ncbi:peptidyl-glycine alpha-amidating monooxygenase B-like [Mizuhopecten yessoensis]|uniref:Peptidyl-glycine alpha-amidating monooxygenase B n=1 Tax=Mizuhopecten yessoensis TaxID=6573 RepID=A0A210PQP5_MIZYE|nr:peptidyl-glycine alpha-amidating monooxygenase B-like [Mizuhopecten yessoensis]OWF38813.1 Peptidyl-glycine alpha-amidating monooxygenase B [Mizuhopecten yessoensis]
MMTGSVVLVVFVCARAVLGLPYLRKADHYNDSGPLLKLPDLNKEVYYQHMKLPLRTFVGEKKIEYGCSAFPLKADEYIVEYLPIGERDDVYHITVDVCDVPYDEAPIWECVDPTHVCKDHKREFLYSWTNGAPGWTLPENTGIYTGNKPRYVIIQVHGRDDISEERVSDFAHMRLKIRTTRPRLAAAVSRYAGTGSIPPHVENFTVDTACVWNRTTPTPILAYGIHTHGRGVALSGYIVRKGKWIEIGRGDPVYPLTMFDITERNIWLQPGDVVATRCTYRNTGNTRIQMGFNHVNEMCNYFLYYGVSSDSIAEAKSLACSREGGGWDQLFDNIPADASDPSGDTEQSRFVKKYHLTRSY